MQAFIFLNCMMEKDDSAFKGLIKGIETSEMRKKTAYLLKKRYLIVSSLNITKIFGNSTNYPHFPSRLFIEIK